MKVFLLVYLSIVSGFNALEMSVHIQPSTFVYVGNNLVNMVCDYKAKNTEDVLSISWQKETSTETYENIATFYPYGDNQQNPKFANTSTGHSFEPRSSLSNPSTNYTASVLTVSNIYCTDESRYRCVIYLYTSITGQTELHQHIYLTTQALGEEPYSLQIWSPKDGYAEGETLTVNCIANVGKPLGIIHWWIFRTNQNVPQEVPSTNNTRPEVRPGTCKYNVTSSVKIHLSKKENGAVVRCSVNRNTSGDVTNYNGPHKQSNQINVYFAVGKPNITFYPNVKSFEVGSNITLICTVTGNPNPATADNTDLNKFTWYFTKSCEGERTLAKNLKGVAISRGNLDIQNLTEIHQGCFKCSAQNGFHGKVYNNDASLQIREYVPSSIIAALNSSKDTKFLPYVIVIGVLVLVMIMLAIVIFIMCRRRNQFRD